MDSSPENDANISARVTMLEEFHAHQQRLLEQLNEVVVALRRDLVSLEKKYVEQQARLKTLTAEHSIIEDDPHERPPHY